MLSGATAMVLAMAVAVPPSAATLYMRTLMSTLAVPSMFATYKLLILKILPLLAALVTICVSGVPVPTAALSMLPLIVTTATIFGFAMFLLRESCEIIVERDSQKPIIIGKKGQSIKKLGIESRKELELFFQKQVYMELFVKVREDWRNNKKMLDQFGYESE